jgi:ABC-type sugar transport system substrate-binding protein
MRIVVALPETENEFQVLQTRDARAAAARLGATVEVLHAQNSAVMQIQQLFRALRATPAPEAIVVEPVTANGMESVLRKAAQAGVAPAVLNTTLAEIPALRAQFPLLPVFGVTSDQVEIGRLQARQIRALLPKGGNVLYVHGPQAAVPAQERFRGLKEALEAADVRLVVIDGQWTEDSAQAAVRRWLRLKSSDSVAIDLVAAQDDSMARGARRAMEEAGDAPRHGRKVAYLGIDGVPEVGQRLVDTGELTATIVMPSNTGPAIEHLVRWGRSGVIPPATVTLPVAPYPDIPKMLEHAGRSA